MELKLNNFIARSQKVWEFISHNWITFILIAVIVYGAFLRLYHLSPGNIVFWGDPVLDMREIERIGDAIARGSLKELPLEGPGSSIEGMHHGAFYYYLLFPAALLSGFHPYGPTLFIVVLNIIALYLIFLCGKKLFDPITGLLAAFIIAGSSFIVYHSRFVWNNNLTIFFFLLALFSFSQIREGKQKYWPLFGFAAAAATQIHNVTYFWVLIFLLPLVFFRNMLPHGKTLLLTFIVSAIPFLPRLAFLGINGILPVQLSWDQQFTASFHTLVYPLKGFLHDGAPFASFIFFKLSGLLPLKTSGGLLWFITIGAASLFGIWVAALGIPAAIKNWRFWLARARTEPAIAMMSGWALASFLVFLIINHFPGNLHGETGPPPHHLLGAMVFFSLVAARSIKETFSHYAPALVALAMLGGFFYSNFETIRAEIWRPQEPTFSAARELIQLLGEHGSSPAALEMNRPIFYPTIQLLGDRFGITVPSLLNGFPPEQRAHTAALFLLVQPPGEKGEQCRNPTLEKKFGFLNLWRCANQSSSAPQP